MHNIPTQLTVQLPPPTCTGILQHTPDHLHNSPSSYRPKHNTPTSHHNSFHSMQYFKTASSNNCCNTICSIVPYLLLHLSVEITTDHHNCSASEQSTYCHYNSAIPSCTTTQLPFQHICIANLPFNMFLNQLLLCHLPHQFTTTYTTVYPLAYYHPLFHKNLIFTNVTIHHIDHRLALHSPQPLHYIIHLRQISSTIAKTHCNRTPNIYPTTLKYKLTANILVSQHYCQLSNHTALNNLHHYKSAAPLPNCALHLPYQCINPFLQFQPPPNCFLLTIQSYNRNSSNSRDPNFLLENNQHYRNFNISINAPFIGSSNTSTPATTSKLPQTIITQYNDASHHLPPRTTTTNSSITTAIHEHCYPQIHGQSPPSLP